MPGNGRETWLALPVSHIRARDTPNDERRERHRRR
jgi:hypothetical protein